MIRLLFLPSKAWAAFVLAPLVLLAAAAAEAAPVPLVIDAGQIEHLAPGIAFDLSANPLRLNVASGCVTVDGTGLVGVSAGCSGGGGGAPGGSSGQIQWNNAGAFAGLTVSGDGTLDAATGVLTVTKANGVAFAASATTDATNAANIAAGILPAARLPPPAATTLGGVKSLSCPASQWLNSLATTGALSCTQPAAADVAGLAASATTDTTNAANITAGILPAARLPGPGATTLGGVKQIACAASTWVNSVAGSGAFSCAQPSAADVAGLAASATTDATNAGNISSGTLALARLGAQSANCVLAGPASGSAAAPTCRVLVAADLTAAVTLIAPQGRLTLTSNTPVMTADAAAQTTVYYAPFRGNQLPVGGVMYALAGQLTFGLNATAHVSGNLYDVFAYVSGGAPALCTGPAWTSSTTRSAAIGMVAGFWVNSATLTCTLTSSSSTTSIAAGQATYLGTFYATANGQTGWTAHPAGASGGSNAILGLWNAYNRVLVLGQSIDTASWTHATSSTIACHASNNNRVSWVDGLAQSPVEANMKLEFATSGAGFNTSWAVAVDATSALSDGFFTASATAAYNPQQNVTAYNSTAPLLGFHFYQCTEQNNGGGSYTMNVQGNMPVWIRLEM